jgi:PGF-pre-PGF domain-containing protein
VCGNNLTKSTVILSRIGKVTEKIKKNAFEMKKKWISENNVSEKSVTLQRFKKAINCLTKLKVKVK